MNEIHLCNCAVKHRGLQSRLSVDSSQHLCSPFAIQVKEWGNSELRIFCVFSLLPGRNEQIHIDLLEKWCTSHSPSLFEPLILWYGSGVQKIMRFSCFTGFIFERQDCVSCMLSAFPSAASVVQSSCTSSLLNARGWSGRRVCYPYCARAEGVGCTLFELRKRRDSGRNGILPVLLTSCCYATQDSCFLT